MSAQITKFTNGLLLKDGQLELGDLWVSSDSGKIISPQSAFYSSGKTPDRVIDLKGKIVSPGFIEVQLNGYNGLDFAKQDPDFDQKFRAVRKELVKSGVTSFTPTMTSSLPEVYHSNLPHLGRNTSRTASEGTDCLGAHVEGPFLNPCKNGIHTPEVLRKAESWSDIERCYGKDNLRNIKYITAAPEQGKMTSLIPEFVNRDIIYSTGHSDATFEQAQEALRAGATMVTHMFNAMRPFGHRDPGIFGLLGQTPSRPSTPTQSPKQMSPAQSPVIKSKRPSSPVPHSNPLPRRTLSSASSRPSTPRDGSRRTSPRSSLSISTSINSLPDPVPDPPFFGLISDGIHLAPPTLKIAYAAHPTGAILVTDAMPLTGLPDGVYSWTNGENIIKQGSLLTLEKNGRIAGSAIDLLSCVNNFVSWTGCGVAEGLRAVTDTPARMLGESRKGRLDIGCDGDLCILEEDADGKLSLEQVWKYGELVHGQVA
ncbi:N-acetyl-glucosamine-6-phosphate deacetylase [Neophaeococcomyces mojaviensis]|uniref:N-acetyl-glucosamine-6-phosphate deacetylase n=1 Tax=Neophaeococcomyces mojaviensis TaxID=3383035 RepID=A0ACC2ZYC0_9EURO|nr:N-acetyl-glucosamine-6-phosphate deacetylase [Knufia sp. JES_112]